MNDCQLTGVNSMEAASSNPSLFGKTGAGPLPLAPDDQSSLFLEFP